MKHVGVLPGGKFIVSAQKDRAEKHSRGKGLTDGVINQVHETEIDIEMVEEAIEAIRPQTTRSTAGKKQILQKITKYGYYCTVSYLVYTLFTIYSAGLKRPEGSPCIFMRATVTKVEGTTSMSSSETRTGTEEQGKWTQGTASL